MTAKARRALIGAALLGIAACFDLGGPKEGVISISSLRLPYPSVVIGDLMRDSLGNPAPLSIVAFGADGEPLPGEPVTFVALDTTVQVDADGTLHGITRDSIGARVVAGAGALQTPPQRIIVTIAPTSVTKGTDATAIQFGVETPDTSNNSNWSPGLSLTLVGAGDGKAQGYVVTYAVIESPDPKVAGTPTAYIGDDAARAMPRDTTDSKGIASRRVILRQSALADDVRSGTRTDSVIVRATVKYLGADVAGSPVDFVVPVSRKPNTP
jgi:hypothetical protein